MPAAPDKDIGKATDAISAAVVDVMLPLHGHGTPGHGDTSSVPPSGNAALDAALKDPVAAQAIAYETSAASGIGFMTGAVVGGVAGVGLMGLAWALWPSKKGSK